jgi:iron(III) transport system substrate-binding protein
MLNRLGTRRALGQLALVILLVGFVAGGALADWKNEWEKVVAAAKREGQFMLFMRRYEGVLDEFKKDYPQIKSIPVTGRGSELGNKIIAERRAGKFLVDVYVGGPYTVASTFMPAKAVDPIADALILPEVVDESRWITGRHRYTDIERKYNFAFIANPGSRQISYNTQLVDPKEFTTYRDLLHLKWKGKIVSLDPTQSYIGATTQFMYYNPELGHEYMRQFFGTMDLAFARDSRQMTDWLAAGKYAICVGCLYIAKAKKQGLPVDEFLTSDWKEGGGISAGGGTISLINQAPHPNAARVFINWFLSAKGQLTLQKIADGGEHHNSGRIDIPKDAVDEDHKLIEGKKYWDQNQAEWSDMAPVLKLAKEIMQARSKQ